MPVRELRDPGIMPIGGYAAVRPEAGDGRNNTEARARDRDAKNSAPGLFGPRGLLNEIRQQEQLQMPIGGAGPHKPSGPPTASITRAEERRLAKEAQTQAWLARGLEAEQLLAEKS